MTEGGVACVIIIIIIIIIFIFHLSISRQIPGDVEIVNYTISVDLQ